MKPKLFLATLLSSTVFLTGCRGGTAAPFTEEFTESMYELVATTAYFISRSFSDDIGHEEPALDKKNEQVPPKAVSSTDSLSLSLIGILPEPPRLQNIMGAWSLSSIGGQSANVEIRHSGRFKGDFSGCKFKGKVAELLTGQTLYNLDVKFEDAPCAETHKKAFGFAVDYKLPSGKRQLVLIAAAEQNLGGTLLYGAR